MLLLLLLSEVVVVVVVVSLQRKLQQLTMALSIAPVDSAQSARSVREDTAELASYFLSDKNNAQSPAFLAKARSQSFHPGT